MRWNSSLVLARLPGLVRTRPPVKIRKVRMVWNHFQEAASSLMARNFFRPVSSGSKAVLRVMRTP